MPVVIAWQPSRNIQRTTAQPKLELFVPYLAGEQFINLRHPKRGMGITQTPHTAILSTLRTYPQGQRLAASIKINTQHRRLT